jgi:hypothetical protein
MSFLASLFKGAGSIIKNLSTYAPMVAKVIGDINGKGAGDGQGGLGEGWDTAQQVFNKIRGKGMGWDAGQKVMDVVRQFTTRGDEEPYNDDDRPEEPVAPRPMPKASRKRSPRPLPRRGGMKRQKRGDDDDEERRGSSFNGKGSYNFEA